MRSDWLTQEWLVRYYLLPSSQRETENAFPFAVCQFIVINGDYFVPRASYSACVVQVVHI